MTFGQRIKERRTIRELTQDNIAKHFGLTREAVQQWEAGETMPRGKRLRELAELLDCSVQWLLGAELVSEPDDESARRGLPKSSGAKMVTVDEVNVTAGNAEGGAVHPSEGLSYSHERVVAKWEVPAEFLRAHTSAAASAVKFITAIGDSNKPVIMPGDKLLVDTLDKMPSPAGFFAIWDGFGEIIKRLEMVPYSNPPRVVLKSANAEYEPRELPLDQVIINGRVVGKWDRT
jgi:transcriptional regulator with XRE-family HTH domain